MPTISRMGWGRSPSGRLLDRAAELGVIGAALGSACSGSGSVLLMEGTAGIHASERRMMGIDASAIAARTTALPRAARKAPNACEPNPTAMTGTAKPRQTNTEQLERTWPRDSGGANGVTIDS